MRDLKGTKRAFLMVGPGWTERNVVSRKDIKGGSVIKSGTSTYLISELVRRV